LLLISSCDLLPDNEPSDGNEDLTWTLTTDVSGHGTITTAPDLEEYADGTVVSLTATPDADSVFLSWSGDLAGHANPADLTMTADLAVTASFYPLVDRDPAVATIALSGLPTSGDHWRITLGSVAFEHTVTVGESTEDVSGALAGALDDAAGLISGAEGAVIAIVDPGGSVLDPLFTVQSGASWSVDTDSPFTRTATLSGSVTGEAWQVTVDGVPFGYTPGGGDGLSEVAYGLAAAVDAAAGYVARAAGTTIVVNGLAGTYDLTMSVTGSGTAIVDTSTASAVTISPAGTIIAGDVWTLTLDEAMFEWTAAPGDDATNLALALADQVDAVPGVIASSEGAALAVVEPAGGAIAVELKVKTQ